jgi:hypothetical protein
MKKAIFSGLVIVFIITGCTPKAEIEGVWRIVSATGTEGELFPAHYRGHQIKIWTEGYFAFIGQFSRDTLTEQNFGWGTYTIRGDRYEELIREHVDPGLIGTSIRMTLMVRNDTLIQMWPANENWEMPPIYSMEKYVRVESVQDNDSD